MEDGGRGGGVQPPMFSAPVENPGFVVEGVGVLKERMKTNTERGRVKPISMLTL